MKSLIFASAIVFVSIANAREYDDAHLRKLRDITCPNSNCRSIEAGELNLDWIKVLKISLPKFQQKVAEAEKANDPTRVVELIFALRRQSIDQGKTDETEIPATEFKMLYRKVTGSNPAMKDFKKHVLGNTVSLDPVDENGLKLFRANVELIKLANQSVRAEIYHNDKQVLSESVRFTDRTAVKHVVEQSKWPQETKDYYLKLLSTH